MKTLWFILILLLLQFTPLVPLCRAELIAVPSPIAADVMEILGQIAERPDIRIANEPIYMPEELTRFYAERNFLPLWSADNSEGRERIRTMMSRLEEGAGNGLCANDYHLVFFRVLFSRFTVAEFDYTLPRLRWSGWYDVLLTDALFHYARHLVEGRVQPDAIQEGWNLRRQTVDLVDLVSRTTRANELDALLQDVLPSARGYLGLQKALERYRQIEAAGGWPEIPAGGPLRQGVNDPRVALLRARLQQSGDLAPDPAADTPSATAEPQSLAAADIEALKRFQRRHGLYPDGVLGEQTVVALNVPVSERVRQIELNMERWRWLPQDLGDTYLQVNIADFTLSVVENGTSVLSMPVVVGNRYRKTPVFSALMTYVEFSPYWYVPPTILTKDKLPLIKADPEYVETHHFEIVSWDKETLVDPYEIDWEQVDAATFPGMLRQKPGPWNALGQVKFMFPNRFSIYLHDTNQRQLFNQRRRQFSSGCIRVKQPEALASYLLGRQGWRRSQVRTAMASETTRAVYLEQPLPVHILYWTAWVDDDGNVNFREDAYGRDRDLQRALSRTESGCRLHAEALKRLD